MRYLEVEGVVGAGASRGGHVAIIENVKKENSVSLDWGREWTGGFRPENR